jgi:uncharacterized protein YpiB (UPF0302 family)
MEKRQSYSEKKKQLSISKEEKEPVNVYVQMLLDEIIYKSRVKCLSKQIDQALDNRDHDLFNQLSNEYNRLLQK